MAITPNIKKKIALGVFAAVIAVGLGAATQEATRFNEDEVCIELDQGINLPSNEVVVDLSNYKVASKIGCGLIYLTLCQICFDPADFVLDGGMPDFDSSNFNNVKLKEFVEANKAVPSLSGIPTTVPGTSALVTLHFREIQ